MKGKLGSLATGNQNKPNEEVTEKMLDELKSRLISVRDKFLLSDKEQLPDHLLFQKEE